jgi:hypothetical protein
MGFDASLIVYCDDPPLDLRARPASWRDAARRLVRDLYPRHPVHRARGRLARRRRLPGQGRDQPGGVRKRGDRRNSPRDAVQPIEARGAVPRGRRQPHRSSARAAVGLRHGRLRALGPRRPRALGQRQPGRRVWESVGTPEPFEAPFWEGGRRPAPDYPLPFHPLELGEAALRAVLGAWFEGRPDPGLADPSTVELLALGKAPR